MNNLNFNYKLKSTNFIEFEKSIKQELRNISFNKSEKREIKRYLDKYISETDYDEIMKTINKELAGPELVKMYGLDYTKNVDKIVNDEDENIEEIQNEVEDQSLEGGDDYEVYENEDDLVEEVEEKEDYF